MDNEEYDPNALDDGEGEEENYQPWEASKERIIALIDADQSMLEVLELEGEEPRSYLAWAVHIVTGVLQSHIRSSPHDEIGIVFYSTVARSESQEMRPFDHVYEYIRMDTPDAKTIQGLSKLTVEQFKQSPGCDDARATPGRAADDLKHALWACWDMLQRPGGGRCAKTVWVFTNNQDPTAGAGENAAYLREQIYTRAQELGSQAVKLDVLPLVHLADPARFDYSLFWRQLLAECRAAAQGLAGQLAYEGQEAAAEMDDQVESLESKLTHVQGLGIYASHRKRPLASLHWTLAPGFAIAVQVFSLVQPQKKPSHIYVTADSHEQVHKSNVLLDMDTGALLPSVGHAVFELKTGNRERFPKVVVTTEESKKLKTLRPKGLTLLGFKPMSALADYHQLSPARFVYPDERALRGSTAAFVALHVVCLKEQQMAICSFVVRAAAMPMLVALLPQQEIVVGDGGPQEVPPGFHLILLPYQDNLRAPERDSHLADKVRGPSGLPRATAEQVAAAEALVSAISLGDDEEEPFTTLDIPNPHLARHFEVLEALALGQDPPSLEEFDDQSAPDIPSIDAHKATLDAFKLAVWDSIEGPKETAKKPSAGAKRKAPDAEAQASVAEEYAQYKWTELAEQGKLRSQTIEKLKVYLRYHSLPLSGNKGSLVDRIQEHIQKTSGAPAL